MEVILQEITVKDVAYVGKITDGAEEIYDIFFCYTLKSKYDGYTSNDHALRKLMNDIVNLEDFVTRAAAGQNIKKYSERSVIERENWEEDIKTLILFLKRMYTKMMQNKGSEIHIGD